MFFSAAILRADGDRVAFTNDDGAEGADGAGDDVCFSSSFTTPGVIRPNNAPTAICAPASARTSASTPAQGAGTSTVTLSVSKMTTGSSILTASPGLFQPFSDHRFRNGFAQFWRDDILVHIFCFLVRLAKE